MEFLFGLMFYAASTQTVVSVYHHLATRNHLQPPRIVVQYSPSNNAYYDEENNVITVYTGLLNFVGNNRDQLAFVLAHELSHFMHHHRHSTQQVEFIADGGAIVLMSRAGYNKCQGIKYLKRLNSPGRS